MDSVMDFETLLIDRRGPVALVKINRPQAMNALNSTVMKELIAALKAFQHDDAVRAVVLTGSDKAFAAGADVKEMQGVAFADAYRGDFLAGWGEVAGFRKPIIAAVAGFALGGGCELAMMCDFIIAASTARFGQPEITLGIIPGMGGTQRLVRAIGKAKAMDLCLTGRMMDATEAENAGLVARVVAPERMLEEALAAAQKIASFSALSVGMAKEAINRAFEQPLSEGLRFERRLFHALFATEDQKEGMAAFVEKRSAVFKDR